MIDAIRPRDDDDYATALVINGLAAVVGLGYVARRFALRACFTNFRTTPSDVERTIALVRELG